MKYGQDIVDPVNDVIRMRNNVLLICSKYSLKGAWVEDEIDKALAAEKDYHKQFGKKQQIIILLNLDDYLFEGYTDGRAATLRKRLVIDFREWKDSDKFEAAVTRLIDSLKIE